MPFHAIVAFYAFLGLIYASTPPNHVNSDVQRAKQIIPRPNYLGHNGNQMVDLLNQHLLNDDLLQTKTCDLFTLEDLNEIGRTLFSNKNSDLDAIYTSINDKRALRFNRLDEFESYWRLELDKYDKNGKYYNMSRNSKCREMVLWYIHHLDENARITVKLNSDDFVLPLLPYESQKTQLSYLKKLKEKTVRRLQGFGFYEYFNDPEFNEESVINLNHPFASCYLCHTSPFNEKYDKNPNTSNNIPSMNGYSFTQNIFQTNPIVSDVSAMTFSPNYIFLLQRTNQPVLKYNYQGQFIESWGNDTLCMPHSIRYHETFGVGKLYITDMGPYESECDVGLTSTLGHCVKIFLLNGTWVDEIGNCAFLGSAALAPTVGFDRPTDIAWDSQENIFISDGDVGSLNNRIVKLLANTSGIVPDENLLGAYNSSNGSRGSGPAEFWLPHELYVDVCDRLWISDQNNYRIQILTNGGDFIDEINFLSSIYGTSQVWAVGITLVERESVYSLVIATGYHQQVAVVGPINMDCNDLYNLGNYSLENRFDVNFSYVGQTAHTEDIALAWINENNADLYVPTTNSTIPPLTYDYMALETITEYQNCATVPTFASFTARILLHPFIHIHHIPIPAIMNYDATNNEYTIIEDGGSTCYKVNTSLHLKNNGTDTCYLNSTSFSFPTPTFLHGSSCRCLGVQKVFNRDSYMYQCDENYRGYVDWFWIDILTSVPLRIMFGSQNSTLFPILQSYSMVVIDVTDLNFPLNYNCDCGILNTGIETNMTGLESLNCKKRELFNWPKEFQMSAIMTPVNDFKAFPTQVLYKWTNNSLPQQRTRMIHLNSNGIPQKWIDAVLVSGYTYQITRYSNGSHKCFGDRIPLGPPAFNWAKINNTQLGLCRCAAVFRNNSLLASDNTTTIIMTCPMGLHPKVRQFWIYWSTNDELHYKPILFMETAAPYQEGTNLAFADYYEGPIEKPIISSTAFTVPKSCLTNYPTNMPTPRPTMTTSTPTTVPSAIPSTMPSSMPSAMPAGMPTEGRTNLGYALNKKSLIATFIAIIVILND